SARVGPFGFMDALECWFLGRAGNRKAPFRPAGERRLTDSEDRACGRIELLAVFQTVEAAVDPPRDLAKRVGSRPVGELVEPLLRPEQAGDSERQVGNRGPRR